MISIDDGLYVLGAFEARGVVSIQSQNAGAFIGRISIDTTTESERLQRVFGNPITLKAYARPTLRYATADRDLGLVVVRALLKGLPADKRLNELLILQGFYLADSDVARQAAMDRLRASRMGLQT